MSDKKAAKTILGTLMLAAAAMAAVALVQAACKEEKESLKTGEKPELSPENFERAKEIFFYYKGSNFNISREAEGPEYYSYGISRQQEKIWKDEIYQAELQKMRNRETYDPFYALPGDIIYSKDLRRLDDLLEVAETLHEWADSFGCLVILQFLAKELNRRDWHPPAAKAKAPDFIRTLEMLKEQVDRETFTFGPRNEDSRSFFPPPAMKERIDEAIAEWEKVCELG